MAASTLITKMCFAVSCFGGRSKYVTPGKVYQCGNDAWPTIGTEFHAWCAANLKAGEPRVPMLFGPDRPLVGGDNGRLRSTSEVKSRIATIAKDLKAADASVVFLDCEAGESAEHLAQIAIAIEQPLTDANVEWTQWARSPIRKQDAGLIQNEFGGYLGEQTAIQPIQCPAVYMNPMQWAGTINDPTNVIGWQSNKVRAAIVAQPGTRCIPCVASLTQAAKWVTRDTHRNFLRSLLPLVGPNLFAFDESAAGGREGEDLREDIDTVFDEWLAITRGVPIKRVVRPERYAKLADWAVASICELADGRYVGHATARNAITKPLSFDGLGGGRKIVFQPTAGKSAWAVLDKLSAASSADRTAKGAD